MASGKASRINLLREFSIPLISGVLAALAWANLDGASYKVAVFEPFWNWESLHFCVNKIFMVFFFGMAAVEITDNFLPGGSLNPPARAVNPLLATLGGVVGPACIYLVLNAVFGLPQWTRGWGIGTATDIALAWLVARVVFGQGHPAVAFLLLLAVADDAVGLAIIAIFYPDPAHTVWLPPLGLVLLGVLLAYGLRRMKVASYWPYLLLAGSACWAGMFLANLHPALALVFVVPFMPHVTRHEGESPFDVRRQENSPLARFEREWKVVVDFGLFLFGLTNAGVEFTKIGPVTWFVLAALIGGKTLGVLGFSCLARVLGFAAPKGLGMKEMVLVGMIAGMGLTVALFIAGAAFADGALQGAAKMGALMSAAIAAVAIVLGRLLRIKKSAADCPP